MAIYSCTSKSTLSFGRPSDLHSKSLRRVCVAAVISHINAKTAIYLNAIAYEKYLDLKADVDNKF